MTFIHNLHGNCIYLCCVHEIMDLQFMKLWLQKFIHLTMDPLEQLVYIHSSQLLVRGVVWE
jgi:hypothetical protein